MRTKIFQVHSVSRASAIAVTVLCAGSASAATPGFYMAGTFGQSSANLDEFGSTRLMVPITRAWSDNTGYNILTWSNEQTDKRDQGFGIAVGYQFSPHFALEAAYIDLGKITHDVPMSVSTDGSSFSDASSKLTVGRRGPALSLVGIWPVTSVFWLDARAGAFHGKSIAKVTFGLEGESPSQEKYTDSRDSIFIGAGVNLAIGSKASIRLGYTHFSEDRMLHSQVGDISLGVRVAF